MRENEGRRVVGGARAGRCEREGERAKAREEGERVRESGEGECKRAREGVCVIELERGRREWESESE